MCTINIALLDNYVGNIDFTLFYISNNYIDNNLLNLDLSGYLFTPLDI